MVGFIRVGATRVLSLPIRSGVAQGCPLSGTLWALGLDPFLRLLSRALPSRSLGSLGACADDIGTILRSLALVQALEPIFVRMQRVATLRLQASKCVIVPLWTELSQPVVNAIREALGRLAPSWTNFRIQDHAKYLGTFIGPGATPAMIWDGPRQKYVARCKELGILQASADISSRLYNSSVITCLSYVSQFYPPSQALLKQELWGMHNALHLPPTPSLSRSFFPCPPGPPPPLHNQLPRQPWQTPGDRHQ